MSCDHPSYVHCEECLPQHLQAPDTLNVLDTMGNSGVYRWSCEEQAWVLSEVSLRLDQYTRVACLGR